MPSDKPLCVYLAIPCYRGIAETPAVQSWFDLAYQCGARGINTYLVQPTNTIANVARQMCVDAFLDNPKATHLAFIDDDMTFTSGQFMALLDTAVEKDLDYVSALAFANMIPTKPCIFGLNPDKEEWGSEPWWHVITDFPPQQVFRIYGSGFGMVLISRRMLEGMMRQHEGKNLFQHLATPNEDVGFFLWANKYGYEMWCDSRVCIGHISKERPIISIETYSAQGDSIEYAMGMERCSVTPGGVIDWIKRSKDCCILWEKPSDPVFLHSMGQ